MKQAIASCRKPKFKQLIADSLLEIPKNTTGRCALSRNTPEELYKRSHTMGNTTSRWTGNSDSKFHTKASSRIRARACLGKPRSINSYIWWLVESKLVDKVLVREIKKNIKEVRQDGDGVMIFCSFSSSRGRTTWVRTHTTATTVCATGGVHTLTCCTLMFFLLHTHSVHTSHILMRVAHMHGSRVSAVRMSSSLCHLTFSLLVFHPSLLLLFLDGLFETTPDYDLDDLTDVSVHAILPNFPDLKAQVKRTPHEDEEFGYLATSALNTGYEPKEFNKITSVDDDTMLINDPTSRKSTNENISVWILCFARFSLVILFLREKAKKACNRETVAWQREREERQGFCDQSCRIDVNEKVDGTILKVILFGLTEDSILMNETSENTLNEGINRIFRVKIQFRENDSRLSTTWRSKIWSDEIQNTHFRVTAWAWISKTTIVESQSMGRSTQRERIHLCSELEMKSRLHQECYVRSWQEVEELTRRCYQEENIWITTKIGRMSCAAWSGIAHSESVERDQVRRLQERLVYNEDSKESSVILTHRAVLTVSTFLIKLLLPRVQESPAAKLECCDMHETIRVFLETFLIVNKLDEILMNYRFVQENWQHY